MHNKNKNDMIILAAGSHCRAEVVSVLYDSGYTEIIEADDGVSAWNYLKNNKVEMVLADWNLSQFNGLVLLELMQADQKLADIPVMLLCSKVNREMIIDAGHAGVSAILIRPFDTKTLQEKIADLSDVRDKDLDTRAETLMDIGKKHLNKGEYKEALKLFNQIVELYEDPEVYYNIGYIRAAQQRYDESIVAFRKAIYLDKKFADAYRALGEVYEKIGQNEKAENMMQRAGEIYMEKSMSKEAEIAFNEVLKLNPNTTNIYNSLGILYRRNREFSKAINAYEKALKIDSEDENILFNLGRACFEAGLLDQAMLYLQKVLKLQPDFEAAEEILKRVKKKMGQSI